MASPSRSDRDVFVRELLSNAQDALEKMRLTSLTNPAALGGADQLNVTVIADPDLNRIVIRGVFHVLRTTSD